MGVCVHVCWWDFRVWVCVSVCVCLCVCVSLCGCVPICMCLCVDHVTSHVYFLNAGGPEVGVCTSHE